MKRQGYKESWAEFFEEWDVLLCPVMPTAAFEHDHDMSRGVSVGTAHPAPLTPRVHTKYNLTRPPPAALLEW